MPDLDAGVRPCGHPQPCIVCLAIAEDEARWRWAIEQGAVRTRSGSPVVTVLLRRRV